MIDFSVVNMTCDFKLSRCMSPGEVTAMLPLKLPKNKKRTTASRKFTSTSVKLQHGTGLIYPNGRVVVVGCKKKSEIKASIKQLTELFSCESSFLRITNVVAHGHFGRSVDFNKIIAHSKYSFKLDCSYEPEIYPALIAKHYKHCTALIFKGGKLIVTGAKKKKHVTKVIADLLQII